MEAGVRSTGTPHAEKPVLQVGTRVQGLWSCSLVFTAAATKYGAQWRRAPSTGPWGRDTRGGDKGPPARRDRSGLPGEKRGGTTARRGAGGGASRRRRPAMIWAEPSSGGRRAPFAPVGVAARVAPSGAGPTRPGLQQDPVPRAQDGVLGPARAPRAGAEWKPRAGPLSWVREHTPVLIPCLGDNRLEARGGRLGPGAAPPGAAGCGPGRLTWGRGF